ncbi:hypothetical protein F183_A36100 [Bryobacterales bacterium F-183]|nr:hypothetical protein F183_A36100 [Bryobacterales bacterium F-183]
MAAFLAVMQSLTRLSISTGVSKLRWEQLLFNFSLASLSASAAYGAAELSVLQGAYLEASVRLFAGAVALFISNNLPAAYMIAQHDGRRFSHVWRECFMWAMPYYILGAAASGVGLVARDHVGWQTALMIVPILYLVYRSYRLYLAQIADEKKHVSDMASLHMRTIEALALAIEAKDSNSHEHLHRVEMYATGIADQLGLTSDEINAVRAAALLHDIGKLAVPEHIISKRGELTVEELERVKIHPVIGAEILERVRFPYPVEPIVRWHHERWDGRGYPDGLRGEDIPIGARILSLVDEFDRLAVGFQSAGSRQPLDEAMSEIAKQGGKAFDPRLIEVLRVTYRDLEKKTVETANDRSRLSGDTGAGRTAAPAAGFAVESGTLVTTSTDGSLTPATSPTDFLHSIASARQEVHTLFELAQDLGNSLSIEETLSVLTCRMQGIVPHDCLVIYLVSQNRLNARHCAGRARPRWLGTPMEIGAGLSGWVAENRKAILNGNPAVEPGYSHSDPVLLRSALAVPLEGVSGNIMGVMTLYSTAKDAFSRDHLRILLAASSKVALSVENALKFLDAENSATTDYLTKLPNARSLYQHLDQQLALCSRNNMTCTVLVCDLDGFKQVNDRFGHLEGNNVLRVVSTGMRDVCRVFDYVARMGGDEFVVVLPGMRPEDVQQKCEELERIAVDAGFQITGERVLAMSIGAANFPEDGRDRESLLQVADERMYAQKKINKQRLAELAKPGLGQWRSHEPPKTTVR